MTVYENLKETYEAYRTDVLSLEEHTTPFAGFLGFGKGAGEAPLHDRFDREVAARVGEMTGDAAEYMDCIDLILFAPSRSGLPGYAVYTQIAAQRHLLPALAALPLGVRASLLDRYRATYPGKHLLPLQTLVLEALQTGKIPS
ncbi:MAG: hypothetical protein IJ229_05280 [Clostridia bacterium]|nr:hypothetical protein [Clostridia bacterium]